MKRIVQQVIVLLTLCWLMPSCSDETFNYESSEGTGYLSLTLGEVDVEFSSSSRAETVSLPENLIPSPSDFMVDIQKDGVSIDGFPKQYNEITGEIELMVGSYTVKADYGENNLIQESPYFSATSTVQILPDKSADLELQVALANAMLVPAVSESLQKHYNAWTLTAKIGETNMTLAGKDNIDGYLFVQAGQSVNALFEGTNLLEKQTSHEWTVISSAEARTKYVIQCDPDLSVFSNIQLTATATHTYTEEILTGTDVVLNINSNGAPLELIDSWDIKLLYNGTPIRTYTAKPENGISMIATDGWPYVPQGSTFSASIHLRTGETFDLASSILNEIPLPEFTTNVFGNTSYSVYKNSEAETANTKDGSSIFDINATPSIDSGILNNPNYSNILNVEYKTDSGQNSGVLSYGTVRQFNSLVWQQHNLSAIVSFDGVAKESLPLECHVTGLPYTLKHPANNYGWYTIQGSDIRYDDNSIHLETWSPVPIVGAPSFHIPETLDFSLDCKYAKNNGSIGSYTFSVNLLKSSDHSIQGEICSHKSNKKGNYDLSGSGSFTSENNAVSCQYGYSVHGNSVSVISMQINYR